MSSARNEAQLRLRRVQGAQRGGGVHPRYALAVLVATRAAAAHALSLTAWALPAKNGAEFMGEPLRVEEARPQPALRGARAAGLPPPPPGRGSGFRVKIMGISTDARWQELKVRPQIAVDATRLPPPLAVSRTSGGQLAMSRCVRIALVCVPAFHDSAPPAVRGRVPRPRRWQPFR